LKPMENVQSFFNHITFKYRESLLLVVDNVEGFPNDEGLNSLNDRPIRVIITSREKFATTLHTVEVRELDICFCRDVFYYYYKIEKNNHIVDDILEKIKHHTVTIELLAKGAQLVKSS